MKINPINSHFVADVDGIDIGTISDEDFRSGLSSVAAVRCAASARPAP
jgi:L-aminopeptidase/D-esterase-like protein